jgi:hypothetical protein
MLMASPYDCRRPAGKIGAGKQNVEELVNALSIWRVYASPYDSGNLQTRVNSTFTSNGRCS